MSVVDDIRAKIDIVEYIGQYVPLKQKGRHHEACCPFHSEKSPSFHVSAEYQNWRCRGACGEGGDLFAFAMKKHGWTFKETLEELGKSVGIEVAPSPPSQKAREQEADKLRGIVDQAVGIYVKLLRHPNAAHALAYARERGLSDDAIERWHIGYAFEDWHIVTRQLGKLGYSDDDLAAAGIAKRGDKGDVYDALRARLIVPIRDERGRFIALAGRTLTGAKPKWLNTAVSPIFHKASTLFALDRAKDAIRKHGAVIVEGYLDAITAHEAGYTNVVAQMGTALTGAQIDLLRNPLHVTLALDADAAGAKSTFHAIQHHVGKVDFRVLRLTNGDPDDVIRANPDAWGELLQNTQPLDDWLIDFECASLPENATFHERQAVAVRLLPLFAQSGNELLAAFAAEKLAERLKLDKDTLIGMALKQRAAAKPALAKPVPTKPSGAKGRPVEFDVVSCLFADPMLYYAIARRFREADVAAMLEPDDFADTTNRALIRLLIEGVHQDDLDALEYVRQQGGAWVDEALAALPKHDDDPTRCIQWAVKLRIWRVEAELEALRQLDENSGSAEQLRVQRRQLRRHLAETWQVT